MTPPEPLGQLTLEQLLNEVVNWLTEDMRGHHNHMDRKFKEIYLADLEEQVERAIRNLKTT